jgi:hypothetical protein
VRLKPFSYNLSMASLRCAAVPTAAPFSLLPPPHAQMYIGVRGVQANDKMSSAGGSRPLNTAKQIGLLGDCRGRGSVRDRACGASRDRVPVDILHISLQRAEGRMLEHVIDLTARTGGMWTVQWPTQGRGTAERSIKVQY